MIIETNPSEIIDMQMIFETEKCKTADDIVKLIIRFKKHTNDLTPIKATYLGIQDCPICKKKIDAICWDGIDYLLEIDMRKDRLSPIHWCRLTPGFLEMKN